MLKTSLVTSIVLHAVFITIIFFPSQKKKAQFKVTKISLKTISARSQKSNMKSISKKNSNTSQNTYATNKIKKTKNMNKISTKSLLKKSINSRGSAKSLFIKSLKVFEPSKNLPTKATGLSETSKTKHFSDQYYAIENNKKFHVKKVYTNQKVKKIIDSQYSCSETLIGAKQTGDISFYFKTLKTGKVDPKSITMQSSNAYLSPSALNFIFRKDVTWPKNEKFLLRIKYGNKTSSINKTNLQKRILITKKCYVNKKKGPKLSILDGIPSLNMSLPTFDKFFDSDIKEKYRKKNYSYHLQLIKQSPFFVNEWPMK